jgi:hypothetical protein
MHVHVHLPEMAADHLAGGAFDGLFKMLRDRSEQDRRIEDRADARASVISR